MAFMIGVYTYNDIRYMQMDAILSCVRTLGAFAAAIRMTISIGVATQVAGAPAGLTMQTRLCGGPGIQSLSRWS